jgi:glycerophosphoryl diester phosphodiesterase
MKTAELLRATTKTLLHNRVKIFTAAIVFHMFSSAVSSVAFNLWFELVLKASGRVNITIANLSQIFSNPLAILISIIFAVVVAFLLFLEFTVLSFLIYSFRYGKKIRFRTMLKNAFKELKVLASPQVILLVLLFISMIPLSGIAFSPFLTEKVSIPRFIIAEIIKTSPNLILLIITGIATLYVNFRLIFTLPLMILTPKSFAKSARISWRISGENQTSLLVIFTMIEFVAIPVIISRIRLGEVLIISAIINLGIDTFSVKNGLNAIPDNGIIEIKSRTNNITCGEARTFNSLKAFFSIVRKRIFFP